jgi:predicted ester cyclase
MTTAEQNKQIVLRFNQEVMTEDNLEAFHELMHDNFINYSAPPGTDTGKAGILKSIHNGLRPAFPDLHVVIYDMIAEGNKVTTRKAIKGTHHGSFMGIPPTGKAVSIEVIDIVTVKDGKYLEYWGINTLHQVINDLKG